LGEHQLVNRKRFVSSLANELVEPFNELSKKTRITKTRLLDEAIEDLLKKYEHKGGCASLSRLCRPPPRQRAGGDRAVDNRPYGPARGLTSSRAGQPAAAKREADQCDDHPDALRTIRHGTAVSTS